MSEHIKINHYSNQYPKGLSARGRPPGFVKLVVLDAIIYSHFSFVSELFETMKQKTPTSEFVQTNFADLYQD